jgi:thiamine pyrophosphate-dependent acetolactate synthase large subunit-like protein
MRVSAADEVAPTIQRALELDVPSVVEIPIDYRENRKFSMNLADLVKVGEGV